MFRFPYPEVIANQNSDGGWGFYPVGPSAVEATAWMLLALAQSGGAAAADVCTGARRWLRRAQLADGSWPAFPSQPQGCWVTSIACQALQLEGGADGAVERGLSWLLDAWPAKASIWWRMRKALFPSKVSRQDDSLRGWSWTPGTASWVEPTAHALLLLRSLPPAMLSARAAKRRELAERMLFDRMCPGGGWNSGNPRIYGVPGVPGIGPTAWALLALRDHSGRAEVRASLTWLEGAYGSIRGAASLALAHRCLNAYGRGVPPLAPAIEALGSAGDFAGNTLTTAWILLALNQEAPAVGSGEAAAR